MNFGLRSQKLATRDQKPAASSQRPEGKGRELLVGTLHATSIPHKMQHPHRTSKIPTLQLDKDQINPN